MRHFDVFMENILDIQIKIKISSLRIDFNKIECIYFSFYVKSILLLYRFQNLKTINDSDNEMSELR